MSKVLLCVFCILLLFPILWMAMGSLQPPAALLRIPPSLPRAPTLINYQAFLALAPVLRWALNSLIVAVAVFLLSTAAAALGAYLFSTTHFRGQKVLYWILISGLMVPGACLIVPRYIVARYAGGVGNWWGIILIYAYMPTSLILLRQAFSAIPRDFFEAARIDGASDLMILLRVVLPQSTAVIAFLALTQCLGALQDFSWPMLVLNDTKLFTLPLGVMHFLNSYTSIYGGGLTMLAGMELAGGVILFLPAVVIFVSFRNVLNKRFIEGGLKQ